MSNGYLPFLFRYTFIYLFAYLLICLYRGESKFVAVYQYLCAE